MIKTISRLVAFFAVVGISFANADDVPKIEDFSTPEEFRLSDGCQKNQLMYNYCASVEQQFYVLKLASIYKELEQNEELEGSKSSWTDFVEKECKRFAKPFEMGSIYPLEIDACRESLTKQRIKTLTSELNCNRDGGCSYPD
jgi:uncharacterized protein YecT (DUF1311 family)